MTDGGVLLPTLDRLFAGPRRSALTIAAFLEGLGGRSYAVAIAALNLPNCVPTGIPWLSTITGVPMLLLLLQSFAGRRVPRLPAFIGRRGFERGVLQDCLARLRRWVRRIERTIRPRHRWWVLGLPHKLLMVALLADIVVLALPIPFDNFLPAWAIFFFCLALIESDGVMAMLGWLLTAATAVWTVFLLMVGHAAITSALRALRETIF